MIFISMVTVKEIIFTCVMNAITVYHHSELDITNFCVTRFLMLFGKGYTHMFSIAWSDSNLYFTCLRQIIYPFILDNPV